MKIPHSRPILISFGLASTALVMCGLLLLEWQGGTAAVESFEWVSHTLEVQRELATVEARMSEAESGQRGYLLTGQPVTAITATSVQMRDGQSYASDLTAVIGYLRGQELGVDPPVVDEKGFVPVNDFFQHPAFPDLFAIGDAATFPRAAPKSMLQARLQAPLAAQNLGAQARGQSGERVSSTRLRQGRVIALPDVGGETAMVLQGGKVMAGSWPLLLRTLVDHAYFLRRSK